MRLRSIRLEHFRSFQSLELDLDTAQVHLLLGPNGSGKTNVLEAISILSLLRSFLASQEGDIVHWGEDFYRLRAQIESVENECSTIEVVSQLAPRKQKVCYVNDVQKPLLEAVGRLPTVAFLPQDLELADGAPQVRRRFLDELLCQVSPEYAQTLTRYQKVLKQRNALLKKVSEGKAKLTDIAQWDSMLSEQGAAIILYRLELMEIFACALEEELKTLGESWQDISLIYERKGKERKKETIAAELLELLNRYHERDVILQSTTVGPHRHDWHVEVEGRPLYTFASRGQQRTAVLALLFLKVSYLELKRGEKPVILLDDVFSELDDAHQEALLQSFDDYQVLITATHMPQKLSGAKVWEMQDVAAVQ